MRSVITVVLFVATYIHPMVNGQATLCETVVTRASAEFNRGPANTRDRSVLLNIAKGIRRPTQCRFLEAVITRSGLSGDCGEMLLPVCPATTTTQTALLRSVVGIPTDCPTEIPECDASIPYRSIDGSCNNLANPRWGQVHRQQLRLLPNAFDDGVGTPRIRDCNGNMLPSARTVSNMIHDAGSSIVFENDLSLLVMQMGQNLVHDLVVTHVFTRNDGTPLRCCTSDMNHLQCNPIQIPAGDPFFDESCMNFARSDASYDCNGIRQVINSQTSYFDLSQTYGSTDTEARSLRSMVGGRLIDVNNKLPIDLADSTCVLSRPFDPINYYCPLAGDTRVIEQPGLASLHTIFMREHNRLADGLASVNPHWGDEQLYQEARKINIGQWHHILYAEYLPTILGYDAIYRYGLHVSPYGYNDNYNPAVDATISNAFAVAVFRFGHSLVHDVLGMLDSFHQQSTQPLERHFFEPDWYHAGNGTGLEYILNWITKTSCPFADRKIQDSIRQKLFIDEFGNSFDLATLNIHRGRDHGTPGYTEFRKKCGLSEVFHFGTGPGGLIDHDWESASLLQQTYACPSDIDLFPGLLSERRSGGSILGPTWQCLLASEFLRLRDGDRFFYERRDPFHPEIGFAEYQLNSIKSVKMSDIICRNTDIRFMQEHAFRRPTYKSKGHGWGNGKDNGKGNALKNCRSHRFKGVNINLWTDRHI